MKKCRYFGSILMQLAACLACSIALSFGGCSMIPSAGPAASNVVSAGQTENKVLFDIVEVDNRVVSTVLAQPKESFHARFEKGLQPPELKIAVGDTLSVTIWESAAGGLFSEALPPQLPGSSRPGTEPLAPESRRPTGGGPRSPISRWRRMARSASLMPAGFRPPGERRQNYSKQSKLGWQARRSNLRCW